jgi:hypothetical protein
MFSVFRINLLKAKHLTFSLARNEKMVEVGDDPLCIIVRVLHHRPAIFKNPWSSKQPQN